MYIICTKVKDRLLAWEVEALDYRDAIEIVKRELGPSHKTPVLAMFKNDRKTQ